MHDVHYVLYVVRLMFTEIELLINKSFKRAETALKGEKRFHVMVDINSVTSLLGTPG